MAYMLNLCTLHCIGAPSVSQIVISYLYTWYVQSMRHNCDHNFFGTSDDLIKINLVSFLKVLKVLKVSQFSIGYKLQY